MSHSAYSTALYSKQQFRDTSTFNYLCRRVNAFAKWTAVPSRNVFSRVIVLRGLYSDRQKLAILMRIFSIANEPWKYAAEKCRKKFVYFEHRNFCWIELFEWHKLQTKTPGMMDYKISYCLNQMVTHQILSCIA